jgi:hypothetical protein
MRNVQGATAIKTSDAKPYAHALDQEADELEALRTGLLHHLDAWRDAHKAALLRLGDVMTRMDAIVARIEQNAA